MVKYIAFPKHEQFESFASQVLIAVYVLEPLHLLLAGLLGIAFMAAVPIASIQLDGALPADHNIDMALADPNLTAIRNPVGIQPSSYQLLDGCLEPLLVMLAHNRAWDS